MKKLTMLAAAGVMLSTMAMAGTEIVAKSSPLKEIVGTKPVPGLRAFHLDLNRDDQGKYSSFTLKEDTGIRCVVAPCPSSKDTKFTINQVIVDRRDTVRYQATEVLTNIPPNVRIVPRKMEVVESSMELVAPGGGGFMRREMWNVRVTTFPNTSIYYAGSPKSAETLEEEME